VLVEVPDALNVAEASVPVKVALSEKVAPTAAVTAPVMVTVHTSPAPMLAAVQVSTGAA
jgi:hypothetical protein